MNISKKVAVVILTLMMLAGCSGPLHDVEVIDKIYEPKRTGLMPQIVGTTTILIPYVMDERYIIVIEGIDEKGNARVLRREVTRDEFEKTEVGDKLKEHEYK